MDDISTTIINLFKLITAMRDNEMAQAITFVSVEDICADLFANIATEQDAAQFAATIRSIATSELDLGTGYERINTLVQRVEEEAANSRQLHARLEALNAGLDQALSIAGFLTSPLIRAAEMHFDDLRVFRLVEQLRIVHSSGQPEIIFIGAISQGKTKVSFRKHRLLDNITIEYDKTSPYPRLNLEMRSISDDKMTWPTAPSRKNWLQRTTEAYNLSLQNTVFKDVGSIRTQQEPRSYEAEGGRFRFIFSAPPGTELFSTTIRNTTNSILAQCIKIVF